MTTTEIENRIGEFIANRDYKDLMELAQFDEDEGTRNMALYAIGQLSHDESIELNIDQTLNFLSQIIHLDIFPTSFGEFESFMASGYFDGGTFSMAAAQLAFLPQWNSEFQNRNLNEILLSIASASNVISSNSISALIHAFKCCLILLTCL